MSCRRCDWDVCNECKSRGQPTFSSRSSGEVAYHGTSEDAARAIERQGFQVSSDGMLGRGVYVSRDFSKAAVYGSVVLELRVNFGRQCTVDCQNHPRQKTWHSEGYDSAHVPANCGMVPSGKEEHCVWDPANITVVRRARG